MRKKLLKSLAIAGVMMLFPMSAMAADGDVAIDDTNFPDETFRTCVIKYLDVDEDGVLSQNELDAVLELGIGDYGEYGDVSQVADVTGIEYFVNLEAFSCAWTAVTEIDLSANTQLVELYVSGTGINSLDITSNVNLEILCCFTTNITELDVTNNINLKELDCSDTDIVELDLFENVMLEELYCFDTDIVELDLRNNINLTVVWVDATDEIWLPDTSIGEVFRVESTYPTVYYSNKVWYDTSENREQCTWVFLGEDDSSSDSDLITEREEVFTDGVLEYEIGAIADISKVTVTSDDVTLVFDEAALESITNAMLDATEDGFYFQNFSIKAETVDVASLDESIQELVGTRPVFDFSIWTEDIKGNRMQISDFGDGSVAVTIAYELAEGESAEGLVIYYIDGDTVETIAIDSYDSVNGTITFTTNHFSTYAVGYEEDVDDATTGDTTADDEDDDTSPETGDTANVALYMMLLASACVGIVIAKKRRMV